MAGYWSHVVERGLIPPYPPEAEATIERNGRVVLTTYPEGETSWDINGLNRSESPVVNGLIDEALSDAYELGQQSMQDQIRLLKRALASTIRERDEARAAAGRAWGLGVIQAAEKVYGGHRQ